MGGGGGGEDIPHSSLVLFRDCFRVESADYGQHPVAAAGLVE